MPSVWNHPGPSKGPLLRKLVTYVELFLLFLTACFLQQTGSSDVDSNVKFLREQILPSIPSGGKCGPPQYVIL